MDENRSAPAPARVRERALEPLPAAAAEPTELERLLASGEFVVSVQLDPPLGGSVQGLVDAALAVRESGLAQVVDVNDNPGARARMSGLMASVAIRRAAGIEVVPHLTPRDSTLAGLESLLLGAHAEGVRNVLAVTGDAPEQGDYPGSGSVYDVDAIGLVELMTRLNAGVDFHGRAIDAPTSFFPGVAVNPTARPPTTGTTSRLIADNLQSILIIAISSAISVKTRLNQSASIVETAVWILSASFMMDDMMRPVLWFSKK